MNAIQAIMNKTRIATAKTEEGVPTLKLRLRPEPSLNDICYERIKDSFYHGVYGDTSSPDTCFKLIIDKNTGYFNATKMCQMGGKQLSNWLKNKTTKELIDWMKEESRPSNSKGGFRATESRHRNSDGGFGPTFEVHADNQNEIGATISGTYVCKELILSLATWISPAFYLRCSRIVNDYFIPKNEETIKDKDELQEVLKQLEVLRLENETKEEQLQLKDDKIDELKAMLLKAEEDRKKASDERKTLHRQMIALGINMSDLKGQNNDLKDHLDEVLDQNDVLVNKMEHVQQEVEQVQKRVIKVQKRLDIAVEERAPVPEDKTKQEHFVLLKIDNKAFPYHVIRAQTATAKKTIKQFKDKYPNLEVLVDLKCHPNSRSYYVRVKETLKERGATVRLNDINIEDSDVTQDELIKIIHDVDAEKRAPALVSQ